MKARLTEIKKARVTQIKKAGSTQTEKQRKTARHTKTIFNNLCNPIPGRGRHWVLPSRGALAAPPTPGVLVCGSCLCQRDPPICCFLFVPVLIACPYSFLFCFCPCSVRLSLFLFFMSLFKVSPESPFFSPSQGFTFLMVSTLIFGCYHQPWGLWTPIATLPHLPLLYQHKKARLTQIKKAGSTQTKTQRKTARHTKSIFNNLCKTIPGRGRHW